MAYSEYKERFDTEDDDTQDTLEFSLKSKFIFKPDKTLPLTGQERITIPHMVVMVCEYSLFFFTILIL